MIQVSLSLDDEDWSETAELLDESALIDEVATLCVINKDKAEEVINKSDNKLKIQAGRKFIVENGGMEDVIYDGRYMIIPTQKPLNPKYLFLLNVI